MPHMGQKIERVLSFLPFPLLLCFCLGSVSIAVAGDLQQHLNYLFPEDLYPPIHLLVNCVLMLVKSLTSVQHFTHFANAFHKYCLIILHYNQ